MKIEETKTIERRKKIVKQFFILLVHLTKKMKQEKIEVHHFSERTFFHTKLNNTKEEDSNRRQFSVCSRNFFLPFLIVNWKAIKRKFNTTENHKDILIRSHSIRNIKGTKKIVNQPSFSHFYFHFSDNISIYMERAGTFLNKQICKVLEVHVKHRRFPASPMEENFSTFIFYGISVNIEYLLC